MPIFAPFITNGCPLGAKIFVPLTVNSFALAAGENPIKTMQRNATTDMSVKEIFLMALPIL